MTTNSVTIRVTSVNLIKKFIMKDVQMGVNMKKISDAEWKIMEILWGDQPKTMMQLTKALLESTGWSKHTVMTYLKRMEEKGFIYHTEGEKAKLYYSDLERSEAILKEKNHFLNKVFKGNVGLLISTMLEHNELSEEEIQQLMEILQKKK